MSDLKERNYLVGILSENHKLSENVGGAFGSPGQKTDIQFYDRLDQQLHAVFCAIDAIGYPDKLKCLIETMMITDYHVLLIDLEKGINAAIGEIIVAMDFYVEHFNVKPFIVIGNINEKTEYNLDNLKKTLNKLISNTALKDAPILQLREKDDREQVKKQIIEVAKSIPLPTADKSKTIVFIDHVFPVAGIGTVILGVVKSGTVTAGEMLNLIGPNKKVIIRSIQKQDRDFKTAEAGDRVGLAIKGIKPEEIDRNMVLAASDLFRTSKIFKIKVKVSPYFKESLNPQSGRQYTMFINLANAPFKVVGGNEVKPGNVGELEIECAREMPIPLHNGKGIIVDLNKFENKLRIVGYFDVLN